MRNKTLIGLLTVSILSVAAGAQLLGRSNAQDPPKKAEPAEKKSENDLFDVLKKALEAKKEPSVPPPSDVAAPISAAAVVPPPLPPITEGKSGSLPPLPALPKDNNSTIPPVTTNVPAAVSEQPVAPVIPPPAPRPTESTQAPLVKPQPETPRAYGTNPQIANPAAPPTVAIVPNPPVVEQVARIKDCPWSLRVEMRDGQTIVSARVNKKHEFKIVCQSLDLQTGKSTLKATGKVQIIGDKLSGACEHLSISLLEDRLVLEGGAQVTIQKISANVSSERAASFELKGATLDLRISELHADTIQVGFTTDRPARRVDWGMTPTIPAPSTKDNVAGKQWTSYGTLRRVNTRLHPGNESALWRLEDRSGNVIATLLARDGGSLAQFEGQTISVLGTSEQIDGLTYLRVTHIALP